MNCCIEKEWLEHVARKYMLHGSFHPDIGLFNGRMGMVLFYFHYARYTGNSLYEDFAMILLESIYEEISVETPIGLARGLSGIGWGILHLHNHHFIEGFIDDTLVEVDRKVSEYHLLRMNGLSLESGFEGIALYLSDRLVDTTNFDRDYKEEFRQKCIETGWQKPISSLKTVLEKMNEHVSEETVDSWQKGLIYLCEHEETVYCQ